MEVIGGMVTGGETPTLDEVSPVYGLGVMGERQRERRLDLEGSEEPDWVQEVIGTGGHQEIEEMRMESGDEVRESLQARIDRELDGELQGAPEVSEGPKAGEAAERVVEMVEPERMAQDAEEVIGWMARRLLENEGRSIGELKESATNQFGSLETLARVQCVVMGIKEGLRRGKEIRKRKHGGRRMNARVQTEKVESCAVRVQTDILGMDMVRMEARAYESIRERWRKSKNKPEPEREGLEETITVEHREEETEVVVEEEENMPALLSEEEFGEIETEYGEGELPVLTREVEGVFTRRRSVTCGG